MSQVRERLVQAVTAVRQRGGGVALEIIANVVLPVFIFNSAKASLGDVHALMASSAAPIAWSIFQFIRRRRVDALSMLVLLGIGLSLLAYFGGGGVKFLQLREKLVTGLIGLIFLGSAVIRRPLMYYLARATILRTSASEAAQFESMRGNRNFERVMTVMTLVWGFGLATEAALGCALVMVLPIQTFMIVSPVVGYSVAGSLTLWSVLYGRLQRRKRVEAAQAAAASANATGQTSSA
jgi:hypothetical protein